MVAHEDSARVDQATQLREAILLAYCQPAVTGFLNFGLLDEDRLGGWQAGLLWRDGTRKPSYDTFKAAIAEVRRRDTGLLEGPRRAGRLTAPQDGHFPGVYWGSGTGRSVRGAFPVPPSR